MRWTTNAVAMLEVGWKTGLSSGEIARQIGGDCTRGAVARKRGHHGLPARSGAFAQVAMRVNGRYNAHGLRALPKTGDGQPQGIAEAVRLGALAGSTPRPWVLRLYGECCFPVDGEHADTLSCCLPVAREAGLYCAGHVAILAGHPWPPSDPSPQAVPGPQSAILR
jgi:hypothetical protein